jgi:hypothetical protein
MVAEGCSTRPIARDIIQPLWPNVFTNMNNRTKGLGMHPTS